MDTHYRKSNPQKRGLRCLQNLETSPFDWKALKTFHGVHDNDFLKP
jgi:hypothetical protein